MKRIKLLPLEQNQLPTKPPNSIPPTKDQSSVAIPGTRPAPQANLMTTPVDGAAVPPVQAQNSPPERLSTSQVSMRLISVSVVLAAIMMYILLNNLKMLPPALVTFASAIYQALSGIVVFSALVVIVLSKRMWSSLFALSKKVWMALLVLCAIIALGLPTLTLYLSTAAVPPPVCSPKTSSSRTTLSPNFVQPIPDYHNPSGVAWYAHKDTPILACTYQGMSGLSVQQTSSTLYAEVDLLQINHKSYDQANFSVQTTIRFINPDDPANPSTLAGLLVQSPAPTTVAGGFAFLLNAAGQWQLKQWDEGDASLAHDHVIASRNVTIDVQQPITLAVQVQHNMISGFINGARVTSYPDDLPKQHESWPREVALEVERPRATPSSQILFSQFILQEGDHALGSTSL